MRPPPEREFSEQEPEWMDLPGLDRDELRKDLSNLEKINRWFGGRWAVRRLFRQTMGSAPRAVLVDLATGYGDHPRTWSLQAEQAGLDLTVVAVDRQRLTLALAREATPTDRRIFYVQADVRQLPLKDASVDAVFCVLALHHFGGPDAVRILQEMKRLGRRVAVALDLERGRWASWAIWLLTVMLLRDPMTQHDARLSARRAFSAVELKKLAQAAGWSKFWHRRYPLFRQAVGREQ